MPKASLVPASERWISAASLCSQIVKWTSSAVRLGNSDTMEGSRKTDRESQVCLTLPQKHASTQTVMFEIIMRGCAASQHIFNSGLFTSLWEAARSLTWSTELHRKKGLGPLMELKCERGEELKRKMDGGKKGCGWGERRRDEGKKEKKAIRGMTGQIRESVCILHPQWELRPAGCVAFLPPPPPPSPSSLLPHVFTAAPRRPLWPRDATAPAAQVASVGRP